MRFEYCSAANAEKAITKLLSSEKLTQLEQLQVLRYLINTSRSLKINRLWHEFNSLMTGFERIPEGTNVDKLLLNGFLKLRKPTNEPFEENTIY